MILKSLRTIVPVVLLVVASSSAVDARPIVFGKPYKINMETGKASCLAMDGVFRYASGGGFTCTMYGPEAKVTQTCNANGQCTGTKEPYRK